MDNKFMLAKLMLLGDHVCLLVTGFGYEHDEAWATNINLFKEFTDISTGVKRLGAASVDMCHVALGIVEAYWEYRLKPWDMAAGVLIVEEAGGAVTCRDGKIFCVFDLSVLVSNGALHGKVLVLSDAPVKKCTMTFELLCIIQASGEDRSCYREADRKGH